MNDQRTLDLARRDFGRRLSGTLTVAALGGGVLGAGKARAADDGAVQVHRFEQREPFPVNAYVVEGPDALVVVDATLTETASRALRARVDTLGKPLAGVLLTHPHPDHYAGMHNLVDGLDVPVSALGEVLDIVRRDDAAKNELVGGMIGGEWPSKRTFPERAVVAGETLRFGSGLTFEVLDIGPAESLHDSAFVLAGERPTAFVGDLAYALMHPYMADGHTPEWSIALERIAGELDETTVLHVGHGAPVTPGFLRWQTRYLDRFDAALRTADWSDPKAAAGAVTEAMLDYLPDKELLFLMQLSIEPEARRLGLWPADSR